MTRYSVHQVRMNVNLRVAVTNLDADSADAAALQVARKNHNLFPNDYLTWYFAVYYPNGNGTSGMQRYAYDPATDSVRVV